MATDPAYLPFPNHMDRLVSLYRSSRCLEFAKSLLRFHPSFDRSMILFQYVVQVLDRPVPTTPRQELFLFQRGDRRFIDGCFVGVDDTGLEMRRIAQRLAEEAFGRLRIAQGRQQEVNGS